MPQTARRLPGIEFESQAPPIAVVLPRMDVAAFVGFASSGPLDMPVPIEDAAQFEDVFGADAPIAWDPEHHEELQAHLGPAVRAFFRNGGRRCWVVRVADADQSQTSVFSLPGLVAIAGPASTGSGVGAVVSGQAELVARSPGSWGDGLRVSTSVVPDPVRLKVSTVQGDVVTFEGSAGLVVGDVVRVTFAGSDWTLVFAVTGVAGSGGLPCWTRVATVPDGARGELRQPDAVVDNVVRVDGGFLRVAIPGLPSQAPPPGSIVPAVLEDRRMWLDVADVQADAGGGTALLVTPYEISFEAPSPLPVEARDAFAERLTLGLQVAHDGGSSWSLSGLGLAAAHPSFAGALPSDTRLYGPSALESLAGPLLEATAAPRFPLAGPVHSPQLYLPLGASIVAGPALGCSPSSTPARSRDGLGRFGASLFLDDALADTRAELLLQEADWIRYQRPDPRRLSGIHSLLSIEEATIVAVPDAVHRSWAAVASSEPVTELSPPDLPPPEPLPADAVPADVGPPAHGEFYDCAAHVPSAPQFERPEQPVGSVYTLRWSATDVANAAYELQESGDPSFTDPETLYRGPARSLSIYGRSSGATLYYRVRVAAPSLSEWSLVEPIDMQAPDRVALDPSARYSAADLGQIHSALLRMCRARGDMIAVLSLPEHYREREAVGYVTALRAGDGRTLAAADPTLSFGALYHPWLYCADAANPALVGRRPPDGAACGVLATAAVLRGSWTAPANVPLQDVVALDPVIGPEAYEAAQDGQINLVRQEPSGFVWLSADTLSADPDLRPIGVRRLLHALRRIALLHGAAYAFEPDSDVLRRTIQRGFEQILGRMFSLGAFAGTRASDGFRVGVAPPDGDGARLVVELRIAPSRPLSFLTVRLVRSASGSLQVEAS